MSNRANHNCRAVEAAVSVADPRAYAGETPATTEAIRHIYVHIPFCARICPYCAFYKDLLDRSETSQFCEALLRELEQYQAAAVCSPPRRFGDRRSLLCPSTIYFGGGTPTALNIGQLE